VPLIVDISVACKWFLEDEKTPQADVILERILAGEAVEAPLVFELEVQNALLSAERAQRIMPADVDKALESLHELPILLQPHDDKLNFSNEISLARAYSLSCYDAAYLSIALRLRGELVTADKPLARAARDLGILTIEV
jgi:predicted nucleic acid-binding protein